jgi:hypothetical protein
MRTIDGMTYQGRPVVMLDDALEMIEDLAVQFCSTQKVDRDYNGQVKGTLVTDSGGLGTGARALLLLAEHGRFRVIAEHGRMVVGYWPWHDPEKIGVKS